MSASSFKTKRAVLIPGPDFRDDEYVRPFYALLEKGFMVDVAAQGKTTVYGKGGTAAQPTVDLQDLHEEDYDLAVYAGDLQAGRIVPDQPEINRFISEMNLLGKAVHATDIIAVSPERKKQAGLIKRPQGMLSTNSIQYDLAPKEDRKIKE